MIKKELFGTLPDGREAHLFTLKNDSGMAVTITDFGATIVSIVVPDRNGMFADVTLGYDDLRGYVSDTAYLGCVVGRYANRIASGRFTIDGKAYQATINDNGNSLHGGTRGFDKALWNAEPIESSRGPSIRCTYVSRDGEEGFPGAVAVAVTYALAGGNAIRIDYSGATDAPTILNMSNHTYFNLTGDPRKTILDHELMIDADAYTPVDATLIPTGEIASVAGTPFDFRTMTPIGARIDEDHDQLKKGGGYDLNWVLNNYSKKLRGAAELYDPESGRMMSVLTDQPGIQFYSGNFLNGTITGKKGIEYEHRTGLAMETQLFPDSPNKPAFPSAILRPGETYGHTAIFRFSVRK